MAGYLANRACGLHRGNGTEDVLVSCYSAASGAPMLPLLYIPERSKQQALRLPHASLSQAVTTRLPRVSAFLPEVIQWIQSRRATGVMSAHVAFVGPCRLGVRVGRQRLA